MYKNLSLVLEEMGITKTYLSKEVLHYEYPKYLSIRLNNSTKFKDEEMEEIYLFLKERGYKGNREYLFEYTEYFPNRTEKKQNRISSIINQRMKKLNLTNRELSERISVSENTISLWRNGKIKNIDSHSILPLCEVLNINPLTLLSNEYVGTREFVSDAYSRSKLSYMDLVDSIYESILDYQIKRGYKKNEIEISPITELGVKAEIEKAINGSNTLIDVELDFLGKKRERLVEYRNAEAVSQHFREKNKKIKEEIDSILEYMRVHDDEDPSANLNRIEQLSSEMLKNIKLADEHSREELGIDDSDEDSETIWSEE